MKANEVPEKIYISYKGYGVFSDDGSTEKTKISQTEYIRADAFIEKAEEYLKTQFIKDVSVLAGGVVNINFSAAIKNFVNYMEGE